MASDDAADLLLEIDQDRRIPVLNLLPPSTQLKVKRLLGYNPSTAGGLMNPDFASLPADTTVERARQHVRISELAPSQLLVIWVTDEHGRLIGGVFASELIIAGGDAPVTTLIETRVPTVSPEMELPEVARLMADFDLLAIPVIDGTRNRSVWSRSTTCSNSCSPRNGAGGPGTRADDPVARLTHCEQMTPDQTPDALPTAGSSPGTRARERFVLDPEHVGDIQGAFGTIGQREVGRRGLRARSLALLAILGPGLIVMVGDNDAGGVATYSQAGQNYGTSLLWVLLLLIPVLIVNQEMVVRLGAVTGVGHARLINERFGRFWAGSPSVTCSC